MVSSWFGFSWSCCFFLFFFFFFFFFSCDGLPLASDGADDDACVCDGVVDDELAVDNDDSDDDVLVGGAGPSLFAAQNHQ